MAVALFFGCGDLLTCRAFLATLEEFAGTTAAILFPCPHRRPYPKPHYHIFIKQKAIEPDQKTLKTLKERQTNGNRENASGGEIELVFQLNLIKRDN